ncbi:hypothetical protein KBB25_00385 [Candidatus Gracilibacteria bacterium]|nr:hypothetical protein [Candidatus Gracilibacteria bacterium]
MGTISDMQGVSLTLERAIHEASKNSDTIPDDLIIGFSPEICIHDTVTTQYIRSDMDTPLSMQEIDTMIEKIEYDSHIRAKEKAKHQYGMHTDDIRLLSSTLTSIYIDDKKIMNPIGFSGKVIRITVLNVFCTSTEFNVMRSIVSSLQKRIISLVPLPLLFPKSIEDSDYNLGTNAYLDIGYNHTTIVFEKDGEIHYFETFSFGTKMLLDMLVGVFPESPYMEIESILSAESIPADKKESYELIYTEFEEYIFDVFLSVVSSDRSIGTLANIFVSGGVFDSPWISPLFEKNLKKKYDHRFQFFKLDNITDQSKKPIKEFPINHALGVLARESLLIKKDPVIRILRYVLYNYD